MGDPDQNWIRKGSDQGKKNQIPRSDPELHFDPSFWPVWVIGQIKIIELDGAREAAQSATEKHDNEDDKDEDAVAVKDGRKSKIKIVRESVRNA